MTGRPRKASDDAILAGAARAISRVGPSRLTLATIAAETNLSAATLVERFGSKRDLLLALSQKYSGEPATHFAAARDMHTSPLAAMRAGLHRMAGGFRTPDEVANFLAFVQLELTDPDFHRYTRAHANAVVRQVRAQLAAAVDHGELAPGSPTGLARAVYVTYNGALVSWAILRTGALGAWLDRELDSLIAPHCVRGNARIRA